MGLSLSFPLSILYSSVLFGYQWHLWLPMKPPTPVFSVMRLLTIIAPWRLFIHQLWRISESIVTTGLLTKTNDLKFAFFVTMAEPSTGWGSVITPLLHFSTQIFAIVSFSDERFSLLSTWTLTESNSMFNLVRKPQILSFSTDLLRWLHLHCISFEYTDNDPSLVTNSSRDWQT